VQFERSSQLRGRAHRLIPGGAHTYAKGDDQYPDPAPGFIQRGLGSHVWDVDGNEFIEYGMGLRSVTLGHAYPSVVAAVAKQLAYGTNFSRPAPIEADAAEKLLTLLGCEDFMVKFSKNGSDATTAAVRLARAHTGRDLVAICADQPFFSTDDWFIGATTMSAGIPEAIRALTVKFHYNDVSSVEKLFADSPGQIACLVLEPEAAQPPRGGFLGHVRRLCDEHGALLIMDETITGFRWHNQGAQFVHGVWGDLAVFGKGMGNGFAVSALVGRRDIMELGGLMHEGERVFLLSTTHGAETHSLAAAIAVIDEYQREPVVDELHRLGRVLAAGANELAARHGIADHFEVIGRPANLIYVTKDADGNRSQPFRTLFMQEMISRGVLGPSFCLSYSHTDADIAHTLGALDGALAVYQRALADGVSRHLVGRSVQPVFRPHT
jgi:glutamate-1-semialdehyde 2,1-aminomutase